MIAVQYQEVSRRKAKYGDIVERNFSTIVNLFGVTCHERTIPNGTPEGKPVIVARYNGSKYVVNLTDWVVCDGEKITVMTDKAYRESLVEHQGG